MWLKMQKDELDMPLRVPGRSLHIRTHVLVYVFSGSSAK